MTNTRTSPETPHSRAALEAHWRRLGVRRASQQADLPAATTGWQALDRLLPGGGYPVGAITELLVEHAGIGEVSLLLPALAARLIAQPRRRLACVSPPRRLNAPALAAAGIDCRRMPIVTCADDGERVWCVEQMARSQAFCAFLVWSNTLDARALRRLQLAAEQAVCPLFVYRPLQHAKQRSPAALRLAISHRRGGRYSGQIIEIVKCRGPAGARMAGLDATRDTAWEMREPAGKVLDTAGLERRPAGNEPLPERNDFSAGYNDWDMAHVARAAFPPLGPR